MMYFLRLIRYQNLLLLALMQLIFHYGFLQKQIVSLAPGLALNDWQFLLLVLSTLCIAGGGYLINDVFDKNIDKINKPERVIIDKHISEAAAYNFYIVLNVIGVGIGFYLSNHIGKPGFSTIFILIAATLYLYAMSLKKSLLVGNILIASMLAISVLIVGIFDLLPIITQENQLSLGNLFKIIIDYAVFAFLINLIREIIKDMEDIEGDLDSGSKSLPIVIGQEKTKIVVSTLLIISILLLGWYSYTYFFENDLYIVLVYVLALVLTPLVYMVIRLWEAKQKKDFTHLSLVLKAIILFGILSLLVIIYTVGL